MNLAQAAALFFTHGNVGRTEAELLKHAPTIPELQAATQKVLHAAYQAEALIRQHHKLDGVCTVPPPGWTCSRPPGNDGPCAASPQP